MAFHVNREAIGDVLNNSDGLRFGNQCDLVHRARDELVQAAPFCFRFSAGPPAK